MLSLVSKKCIRLLSRRSVQTSGLTRATREREVIEFLGKIIEPLSQESLNSIAAIQSVKVAEEGRVIVDLNLFVPGYPRADEVIEMCKEVLKRELPWMTDTSFSLIKATGATQGGETSSAGVARSLRHVQHIIGVSSCKGGVGKSTTAVNLACTLAKRGLSVGLLDADVYGPSLPHLLTPDEMPVVIRKDPEDPRAVMPLTAFMPGGGVVKFLSFGHVNPKAGVPGAGGEGAAVIRGPIASRVINQLIANTTWGELDYLVVDMPPGTGDIQITLNQSMSMTGSVLVTTPHPLATADVLKGHQMMQAMHVPTLALVENMSHFTCDLGTRYFPFGRLDGLALQQQLQRARGKSGGVGGGDLPIVSFPLTGVISQGCASEQSGEGEVRPTVLSSIEDNGVKEINKCYDELADAVIGGIFQIQLGAQMLPQVTYSTAKRCVILRYFTVSEAIEHIIPVVELRTRDPSTGLPLPAGVVPSTVLASLQEGSIYPTSFDSKGNYGVAIVWSDGHFADIYPFDVLKLIALES